MANRSLNDAAAPGTGGSGAKERGPIGAACLPGSLLPTRPGKTLRLGELLCSRGVITRSQLEEALDHQRHKAPDKRIGEIIAERGMATAAEVLKVLAESLGIAFIEPTPDIVDLDALAILPGDYINEHNLLPVSVTPDELTIAAEEFTDVHLIEDISSRVGRRVRVLAADPEKIAIARAEKLAILSRSRPLAGEKFDEGLDDILGDVSEEVQIVHDEPDLDDDAPMDGTDSPTVKLVNYTIQRAVALHASDIHIEPDGNRFRVRYRVEGELFEALRPSSRMLPAVISRVKILGRMDISERRLPQDGSVTLTVAERPIDLRISTMTTRVGEKAVIRIVDRESSVRHLDALGFSFAMLAQFRAITREANGIVLVTGPTGSGKTTTLYAALAELVSDKVNISTVEDPVERRLRGTSQFQVHTAAGFTFATALRSLLRQDPDIIMIGEIRDAETAKLATEAALTGHLVLSTLHTNDTFTAVPRLMNMGVPPYLVAATLRGVLAQRLLRQICPHCRQPAPLTRTHGDALRQMCGEEPSIQTVYEGCGCSQCGERGFSGRIGIFELLSLNESVLSSIVRDPALHEFRELTRHNGYVTLLQDGLAKVEEGQVTIDGLLEVVSRT